LIGGRVGERERESGSESGGLSALSLSLSLSLFLPLSSTIFHRRKKPQIEKQTGFSLSHLVPRVFVRVELDREAEVGLADLGLEEKGLRGTESEKRSRGSRLRGGANVSVRFPSRRKSYRKGKRPSRRRTHSLCLD
jgi:hypothetical protein